MPGRVGLPVTRHNRPTVTPDRLLKRFSERAPEVRIQMITLDACHIMTVRLWDGIEIQAHRGTIHDAWFWEYLVSTFVATRARGSNGA